MMDKYIGTMEDAYKYYLINLIEGENHEIVLTRLFNETFVWYLDTDSARCDDGIKVREQFAVSDENYNHTHIEMFGSCNMLEMFIGLAYRIASITAEIGQEEQMVKWFWDMMINLNLEYFSDDYYYFEDGIDDVDTIIERFSKREYGEDGTGGPFPISKNVKGYAQNDVDLWYQMSAYLNEKVFNDTIV